MLLFSLNFVQYVWYTYNINEKNLNVCDFICQTKTCWFSAEVADQIQTDSSLHGLIAHIIWGRSYLYLAELLYEMQTKVKRELVRQLFSSLFITYKFLLFNFYFKCFISDLLVLSPDLWRWVYELVYANKNSERVFLRITSLVLSWNLICVVG